MVCQLCDGPLEVLGVLANRRHYRCRDCGMQCSKVADKKKLRGYTEGEFHPSMIFDAPEKRGRR